MTPTRNDLNLDAVVGRLLSPQPSEEDRAEQRLFTEAMALYDAVVLSPHRSAARNSLVFLSFKEPTCY